MKIWLLRPIDGCDEWNPWYDKAFGFVVCANSEQEAREAVHGNCGDEHYAMHDCPWRDPMKSTCVELTADGDTRIIMRDFAAA